MTPLDEFRRGLYPILVAGDVVAFQAYLRRWEDLIGDTAEIAETPASRQRQTMAALLRRPQQFNLPPWPRDLHEGADAHTRRRPSGADTSDATPTGSRRQPGERLPPAAPAPRPGERSGDRVPPAERVAEPPSPNGAGAYFQLDMLTGEMVPVAVSPHSTEAQTASGTLPGGAEAAAGGFDSAAEKRQRRRRRARRHGTVEVAQLMLWERLEPPR